MGYVLGNIATVKQLTLRLPSAVVGSALGLYEHYEYPLNVRNAIIEMHMQNGMNERFGVQCRHWHPSFARLFAGTNTISINNNNNDRKIVRIAVSLSTSYPISIRRQQNGVDRIIILLLLRAPAVE